MSYVIPVLFGMPVLNDHILKQAQPDHQLDTSGLRCPLPLLKLKQTLNHAKTGERIYLVATDPHSEIDIGRFCQRAGHQLDNMSSQLPDDNTLPASTFHFMITKV